MKHQYYVCIQLIFLPVYLWCMTQCGVRFSLCAMARHDVHTQPHAFEINGRRTRGATKAIAKFYFRFSSQRNASGFSWPRRRRPDRQGISFYLCPSPFTLRQQPTALPRPLCRWRRRQEQERLGHYNLSTGRMRNAAAGAMTKQSNWQRNREWKGNHCIKAKFNESKRTIEQATIAQN